MFIQKSKVKKKAPGDTSTRSNREKEIGLNETSEGEIRKGRVVLSKPHPSVTEGGWRTPLPREEQGLSGSPHEYNPKVSPFFNATALHTYLPSQAFSQVGWGFERTTTTTFRYLSYTSSQKASTKKSKEIYQNLL